MKEFLCTNCKKPFSAESEKTLLRFEKTQCPSCDSVVIYPLSKAGIMVYILGMIIPFFFISIAEEMFLISFFFIGVMLRDLIVRDKIRVVHVENELHNVVPSESQKRKWEIPLVSLCFILIYVFTLSYYHYKTLPDYGILLSFYSMVAIAMYLLRRNIAKKHILLILLFPFIYIFRWREVSYFQAIYKKESFFIRFSKKLLLIIVLTVILLGYRASITLVPRNFYYLLIEDLQPFKESIIEDLNTNKIREQDYMQKMSDPEISIENVVEESKKFLDMQKNMLSTKTILIEELITNVSNNPLYNREAREKALMLAALLKNQISLLETSNEEIQKCIDQVGIAETEESIEVASLSCERSNQIVIDELNLLPQKIIEVLDLSPVEQLKFFQEFDFSH